MQTADWTPPAGGGDAISRNRVAMYEAHFGLKSRAFGSKAEGSGVFTGPRQVEIMTSVKKALAAHDAVVTVTGPVGVGKTTIVNRSLETLSPGRMAAWVGRMALAPDEVLDLLLAGSPLNEPISQYGPFVMNTPEEIEQAIRDYNSGHLVA